MCVPIAVPGLRRVLRAGGAIFLIGAIGALAWPCF